MSHGYIHLEFSSFIVASTLGVFSYQAIQRDGFSESDFSNSAQFIFRFGLVLNSLSPNEMLYIETAIRLIQNSSGDNLVVGQKGHTLAKEVWAYYLTVMNPARESQAHNDC